MLRGNCGGRIVPTISKKPLCYLIALSASVAVRQLLAQCQFQVAKPDPRRMRYEPRLLRTIGVDQGQGKN